MSRIRPFQSVDDICIFDSHLDESLSTYDAGHFDALAKGEEGHFWFQQRKNKILQTFQRFVAPTSKILEVGGGTGFIAAHLKEFGFSVEMADIHSSALSYAKKRGISPLYQFDLFNPPFLQEYDVICLFDVLEHLHEPVKALLCLKSMLKPGGMVILTLPAHSWLWSRDDVIAGHQSRMTKKQLRALFLAAGLQPLHLRYFFSAILPLLLLRRWMKKDDGSPLKQEEVFAPKIHPSINRLLSLATRVEFFADRFLPNLAGGSLLGIATV